ncbi:class I SAM-dependent methyltransferase [Nocardiopsis nanhaiensis]
MNHRSDDRPDRPQASTDHTIVTDAYTDGQPLTARQRLYDHQTPRYDLPGMVLEQAGHRTGVWADVGCGNGRYLQRIRSERPGVRTIGLDLSASMLTDLPGPVVCADAAHLPLRSQSAQVVLAMHMLYHVDAPDRALAEAARVLDPGGILIASSNSRYDKAELDEWWAQAAADVLGTDTGPKRMKLSEHFPAEGAAEAMGAHFAKVDVITLDGVIEVNTPDPILNHYASYRAWSDGAGVPFEPTLERVVAVLSARLKHGPLRITTRQALIIGHRCAANGPQPATGQQVVGPGPGFGPTVCPDSTGIPN